MSLRSEAVEAMAQAFCGPRDEWMADNPEAAKMVDYDAMLRSVAAQTAEPLLDALLDFLDAHTEEWADGEGKPYCMTPGHVGNGCDCPSDDQVRWLVAALRGTTEEQ